MLFKFGVIFVLGSLLLVIHPQALAGEKKQVIVNFSCEEILQYISSSKPVSRDGQMQDGEYPHRVKRYVVAGLLQHYMTSTNSLYFRGHEQPFYQPGQNYRDIAQQLLNTDKPGRKRIYESIQRATPVRGPRGSVEAIYFPTNPGDLKQMEKDIEAVIVENQLTTESARDLYFTLLLSSHTKLGDQISFSLVTSPRRVLPAVFEGIWELGSNSLRFRVNDEDIEVSAGDIYSLKLLTP